MGVSAYLSLIGGGGGGGGRLFEAGRLLTFFAFRMGAYLRWAVTRGWALIRINTVIQDRHKLSDQLKIGQYYTLTLAAIS